MFLSLFSVDIGPIGCALYFRSSLTHLLRLFNCVLIVYPTVSPCFFLFDSVAFTGLCHFVYLSFISSPASSLSFFLYPFFSFFFPPFSLCFPLSIRLLVSIIYSFLARSFVKHYQHNREILRSVPRLRKPKKSALVIYWLRSSPSSRFY